MGRLAVFLVVVVLLALSFAQVPAFSGSPGLLPYYWLEEGVFFEYRIVEASGGSIYVLVGGESFVVDYRGVVFRWEVRGLEDGYVLADAYVFLYNATSASNGSRVDLEFSASYRIDSGSLLAFRVEEGSSRLAGEWFPLIRPEASAKPSVKLLGFKNLSIKITMTAKEWEAVYSDLKAKVEAVSGGRLTYEPGEVLKAGNEVSPEIFNETAIFAKTRPPPAPINFTSGGLFISGERIITVGTVAKGRGAFTFQAVNLLVGAYNMTEGPIKVVSTAIPAIPGVTKEFPLGALIDLDNGKIYGIQYLLDSREAYILYDSVTGVLLEYRDYSRSDFNGVLLPPFPGMRVEFSVDSPVVVKLVDTNIGFERPVIGKVPEPSERREAVTTTTTPPVGNGLEEPATATISPGPSRGGDLEFMLAMGVIVALAGALLAVVLRGRSG